MRAGLNILVAGGTQAGKTTMLNCLAAAIPGGERVVSAEEVFELRFPHPDWVPLQTRQAGLEGTGEIRLRDLVKESLRMRPSRIIVGEVRVRGVPRPAARAERRPAGHVHAPRQQRPRGAGEDVHAAAAGGGEHLGPVRRARRSPPRSTWSSTSASTRTACAGSTRSSVCPGRVENDIIETETVFERGGGELRRAQRDAAAARAVRAGRDRRPPAPEPHERAGAGSGWARWSDWGSASG